MLRKKLFIGVVALGVSSFAFANGDVGYAPSAPAYNPGVYLGLQGGYGISHLNQAGFVKDGNGFAGRAFLGYDFHPNFAVEGGFTYAFTQPNFTGYGRAPIYIIDLVGKIKANVVDNFGVYAKLGADYMIVDKVPDLNGTTRSAHDTFGVVYGAGAYYEFTPNVMADLSWTRFGGNPYVKVNTNTDWKNKNPDYDFFALGVSYKFDLN